MGLASIPRSVGHNFVPEYQISAVPYIVDLSTNLVETYKIFRKADNLLVGHSEANDSFVSTHGVVPDTDIFNDTSGDGIIQDSEKMANNLKNTFDKATIKTLKLPKISQWIQFIPTLGNSDGIVVGFSRSDIHNNKTIQFLDNSIPSDNTAQSIFYPTPFKIRCTNLYFTNTGIEGKLLVGLTSIDRSEFTEVVETFLGD